MQETSDFRGAVINSWVQGILMGYIESACQDWKDPQEVEELRNMVAVALLGDFSPAERESFLEKYLNPTSYHHPTFWGLYVHQRRNVTHQSHLQESGGHPTKQPIDEKVWEENEFSKWLQEIRLVIPKLTAVLCPKLSVLLKGARALQLDTRRMGLSFFTASHESDIIQSLEEYQKEG